MTIASGFNFAVKVSSGQEINADRCSPTTRTSPGRLWRHSNVARIPPPSRGDCFEPRGFDAYQGYQLWIDPTGHLRVRIISNYSAGNYIEVESSFVVTAGNWHDVAVSYDGSNLASGVKIYLDGVQDTATNDLGGFADRLDRQLTGPLILGNQAGYGNAIRSQRLARPVFDFECGAIGSLYRAIFVDRVPLRRSMPIRCSLTASMRIPARLHTTCRRTAILRRCRVLHVDAGAVCPSRVTYTPQAGFIGTDTFSYTETTASGRHRSSLRRRHASAANSE